MIKGADHSRLDKVNLENLSVENILLNKIITMSHCFMKFSLFC